MNYLDIILAIPLAFGAIRGFRKGFISEIASLAGLILGILLGVFIADIIGLIIEGILDINVVPVKIISFLVIFATVLIVMHMLAKLIEKVIKIMFLNPFNRIAGIIVGGLKTAFILSILLIFFNMLNDITEIIPESKQNKSLLYNPVSNFAPSLLPKTDFLNIGMQEWLNSRDHEEIVDEFDNNDQ